jgi:hypothetical protein
LLGDDDNKNGKYGGGDNKKKNGAFWFAGRNFRFIFQINFNIHGLLAQQYACQAGIPSLACRTPLQAAIHHPLSVLPTPRYGLRHAA